MDRKLSAQMFKQANQVLVGGVNSPVRAFKSVGGDPVFFESAKGSKLRDVDGNEYIDYVGSWGPMILGHADPKVTEELIEATKKGTSFGAPGEMEHKLGELVCHMVPGVEKVRFVNSGTEATMSALRLARGVTGRSKIIKFEGCYHGHGDAFLIKAGSGALTFGVPDSAGITENVAKDTLTAQYNHLNSVEAIMAQYQDQVAAVIIEPVAGNMGVIPPEGDFLRDLKYLCERNGTLLIFDEVMTGFRVAKGGAQERFSVLPHITTLGKVIGGGLPVGAYGSSAKIMDMVSPTGPIYQAGTLSGNPLAMTAGFHTLSQLKRAFYRELDTYCEKLELGLLGAAAKHNVPVVINRVGSMITVFFTNEEKVGNFSQAKTTDTEKFGKFFNHMLVQGVYLPPSGYESWFVSGAHSEHDLKATLGAAEIAFGKL